MCPLACWHLPPPSSCFTGAGDAVLASFFGPTFPRWSPPLGVPASRADAQERSTLDSLLDSAQGRFQDLYLDSRDLTQATFPEGDSSLWTPALSCSHTSVEVPSPFLLLLLSLIAFLSFFLFSSVFEESPSHRFSPLLLPSGTLVE